MRYSLASWRRFGEATQTHTHTQTHTQQRSQPSLCVLHVEAPAPEQGERSRPPCLVCTVPVAMATVQFSFGFAGAHRPA